jgi:hypothetical protein
LAGQVIIGAVESMTVTVKEQAALMPRLSVTVQFTVVVPNGNVEPLMGAQLTTGIGSQSLVPVTVNVTTAPAGLVHSFVRFTAGQLTITFGNVTLPTTFVSSKSNTHNSCAATVVAPRITVWHVAVAPPLPSMASAP